MGVLCIVIESTIGLKVDIFKGYLDTAEHRSNSAETLNIAVTVRTPTTNLWLWYFHKFLKNRLSSENLDFLIACNRFLSKLSFYYAKYGGYEAKAKQIITDKDAIIDKYFSSVSDSQINVGSTTTKLLEKNKRSMEPAEMNSIFLEVYNEVLRMLQLPFSDFIREHYHETKKSLSRRNSEKFIAPTRPKKPEKTEKSSSKQDEHDLEFLLENPQLRFREVFRVTDNYEVIWMVRTMDGDENTCCGNIFQKQHFEIDDNQQETPIKKLSAMDKSASRVVCVFITCLFFACFVLILVTLCAFCV